jgi:hypothetical protein
MRGVGQADIIELMTFRHAEDNEGREKGVERGNRGFYGGKLLKGRSEMGNLVQVSWGQYIGGRLV